MTSQQPRLHLVSPQPKSKSTANEIELTIKEYLLALRQAGRTTGTLQKYAFRLDRLSSWLAERDVTQMGDLSKLLLREWGASLDPDWQPATMRHAVTIVRGWLNWCAAENLIEPGLAAALRVPKVKSRVQRPLSDEEVQKLLDACDPATSSGLRAAAIVSLMVDSGLRASEVCRVKESDLIFDFPLKNKRVNFIPTICWSGWEKRRVCPAFLLTACAAPLPCCWTTAATPPARSRPWAAGPTSAWWSATRRPCGWGKITTRRWTAWKNRPDDPPKFRVKNRPRNMVFRGLSAF